MSYAHHAVELRSEQLRLPENHAWRRLPLIAAIVGGLGLAASAGLGVGQPKQFFFSYLVAFMFGLSFAIGGLFFVLIQFASRAAWSVVVRRVAENAAAAVPVFAVLFLPIAFGAHDLFHWSHAEAVAHDALLAGKSGYLNLPFFFIRAFFYFALWTFLSQWYLRRSLEQDRTGDKTITRRLQNASGPSIVVTALTMNFAAFDWLMSLDPHWYSTMFGVYYFAGCLIAIFAFLAIVTILMRRSGLLENIVTREHDHDLGKLLFGFTVFWTYIAFSQYFLIWYANIPEETVWYAHRMEGSWKTVSVFLMAGHFVIPFFYLMPRAVKRNRVALFAGASWMLLVHYVDIYWLAQPVLNHHGAHFSLLDGTTLLGVGGVFIAVFARFLARHALVPHRDPRLPESLRFENV
ncbi:MAG: hypothetical protein M5R36_28790 [Deltaproteobacteria bacterium]|nr:hypothetical protein [Deltaproteobacteria bacterium]